LILLGNGSPLALHQGAALRHWAVSGGDHFSQGFLLVLSLGLAGNVFGIL